MNIEEFRSYCLSKKGATEGFPFGEQTLVFKVMGKMFALCGLEGQPYNVNLKCEPEKAIELREEYDGLIKGAYHMNKKHWNSFPPELIPMELTKSLVDHSYDLVVQKLTKKERSQLDSLEE